MYRSGFELRLQTYIAISKTQIVTMKNLALHFGKGGKHKTAKNAIHLKDFHPYTF